MRAASLDYSIVYCTASLSKFTRLQIIITRSTSLRLEGWNRVVAELHRDWWPVKCTEVGIIN